MGVSGISEARRKGECEVLARRWVSAGHVEEAQAPGPALTLLRRLGGAVLKGGLAWATVPCTLVLTGWHKCSICEL